MQSALLLLSAALGHYENPYLGPCASDEQSISITGITGEFCSPACSAAGACPTDVPAGTTAKPTCDLNSPQGAKYCSLVCAGGAAECPTSASCKAIQGTGICTYDATPPGPTPPGPTPPGPTPPGPTPTPPTPTPPTPPGGAKWYMLPYRETIIIGVGVVSANTAYFAAGDNGIGAQVLKTTDGGSSFTPVPFNDSSPIPPLMILSAAAASEKSAIVAGILTEHYTADGESFENALGPNILVPGPSQCAKRLNGHGHTIAEQYGLAGTFGKDNGVAFSKNGGRSFTEAKTVPVDPNYALARYASFPTETTWYVSLGSFPEAPNAPSTLPPKPKAEEDDDDFEESLAHRYSSRVNIIRRTHKSGKITHVQRLNIPTHGVEQPPAPAPTGGWSAVIAKTTDAGETWSIQFNSNGSFYFNDISCYDADHCVAVGEGDGAVEPGNRIYATKNGGATWELTHRDATPSMGCMGVRMVSPTDVMAGCYNTVSQFKITALFLTSKDGGYTWTQDAVPPPHGAVITDLDAVSMTAGFATAITSEEQSAIYKLSLIAPTMPPTPPPHPNRPGQTHYGNPFDGACETGERNISITGVPGAVCAPICTGLLKNKCSTDLPPGVTATPQCDISDSTYSDKLCALMCDVGAGQCGNYTDAEVNAGTGAKCRAIQGEGICTYGIAFAAAEDEETVSLVMKKKQTERNAIPMMLVQ